MEFKGRVGLALAGLLVLCAALTPIEYAPAAFLLLLAWAAVNRISMMKAVAASALFALSMGVSAVILGMGVEHGILAAFRALSLLLPVYVYFSGQGVHELNETLRSLGVPEDFSFMLSLSSTYSGVMGRKAKAVRVAQKCRGSRSPWSLLMPLLNFVFERARMLAISLECRGWSPQAALSPLDNNKNVD